MKKMVSPLYYVLLVALFSLIMTGTPSCMAEEFTIAPDEFEPDGVANPKPYFLTDEKQLHNFHIFNDSDWVIMFFQEKEPYEIEILDPGTFADPVINLYDRDGHSLLMEIDGTGYGENEKLSFSVAETGAYYISVRQYNPNDFGPDTNYYLQISRPALALSGPFPIDPASEAYTILLQAETSNITLPEQIKAQIEEHLRPAALTLITRINGMHLSLTWDHSSEKAPLLEEEYVLYYAPIPYEGPHTILSINMGMQKELEVDLFSGAAYYATVTAKNRIIESDYSNIEAIFIQ